MARPQKVGLDYFPLDVDWYDDTKVQLISSEFGVKGELIYLRLLCRIYKQGYYCPWGKDEALLFAKSVGNCVTGALVNEVVQGCLKRALFDRRVFDASGLLTSRGIQERYGYICKQLRRPFDIIPQYDCRAQLAPRQQPDKKNMNTATEEIPVNSGQNHQRKINENKENEMRARSVDNAAWLQNCCMAYNTDEATLLAFCNAWIPKAQSSMKFMSYQVNSLIAFMLQDFEKEKACAQKEKPQHYGDTQRIGRTATHELAAFLAR